jgi:monoterpene epsilon-lactone hydrolase
MASLEAMRYADMLRHAPRMVDMQLCDQRAAGEHAEDLTVLPVGITYQGATSEGIVGLWAIPERAATRRAILYLFGGGHVISSIHARRKFGGHLANAARCRVLIASYRLAPEHPFPADVEDATAAYRFLLGQGYSPHGIAIGGESSAGGLTMSTLFALRDAGSALPSGAFLLSPWIDLTCASETHLLNRDVDLTATTASLHRMAGQYLAGTDPRDPRVNALFADLSNLPPLFVQVGGVEILLDDSLQLVRRAAMHGTASALEIWPDMQHFFQIAVGIFPEAGEALARVGRWIQDQSV